MALHLNPLTVGRLVEHDGRTSLALRSFAPRRSYWPLSIARDQHPDAFESLHAWVRGVGRAAVPAFDPALRAAAVFSGLLLSDDEIARVPADAGPAYGDGSAVASALDPGIAAFLSAALRPNPLPAALADTLAQRGFVELPPLLDDAALRAVRQFYRILSQGGWIRQEQGSTARRIIHNDPVARHILEGLTPAVAAVAQAPVKPSYSYAAEYGPGQALPRHVDRAQCEYTISLFLDHRPAAPGDACPWPLTIHAPDGDVVVRQPAGGGPLFRGRELPHSRPPLPEGQQSQMLFLHYVPADFCGPLD